MLWAAFKVLLVYCAAGPLIGLFVFAAGVSLTMIVGGQPGGAWLGPLFLLYGLFFAHFFGMAWAALAALTAVSMWRMVGATPAWIGPAGGLVSFALAALTGHVVLPLGSELPTDGYADNFELVVFWLMALVHVSSAWVCWLASRGMLRT
jgi:hypothetical protein